MTTYYKETKPLIVFDDVFDGTGAELAKMVAQLNKHIDLVWGIDAVSGVHRSQGADPTTVWVDRRFGMSEMRGTAYHEHSLANQIITHSREVVNADTVAKALYDDYNRHERRKAQALRYRTKQKKKPRR